MSFSLEPRATLPYPLVPLPLRDMCLLDIIMSVDTYPPEYLSLLPPTLRRRLFLGLPDADIFHYSTTALFSGVDSATMETRLRLAGDRLVRGVLYNELGPLALCMDVNIPASLFCFDQLSNTHMSFARASFEPFWEHVKKRYRPFCRFLSDRSINLYTFMHKDKSIECTKVITPNRLLKFVTLSNARAKTHAKLQVGMDVSTICSLLVYCNMPAALKSVTIYPALYAEGVFWNELQKQNQQVKSRENVSVPFLVSFLSSVETLELKSESFTHSSSIETATLVSCAILNSVTVGNNLKHLKIDCQPSVLEGMLPQLGKLFVKQRTLSLSRSSYQPPLLETLSIKVPTPYSHELVTDILVQRIASTLNAIITFQLGNLCEVTLNRICCYSSVLFAGGKDSSAIFSHHYRDPLSTTLPNLLKQPQFRSLVLDHMPSYEACILVETFLQTRASHMQTLVINKSTGYFEFSDSRMPVLRYSLPDSNTHFKCLDIAGSSSSLCTWLFNIPELKLHKLNLPDINCNILLQRPQTTHVENVVFDGTLSSPSLRKILEKLLILNPYLKCLQFNESSNTEYLFPALIHCLTELYQQGRGLEELHLHRVLFDGDHGRQLLTLVRDLSQCSGTVLVVSSPQNNKPHPHTPADQSLNLKFEQELLLFTALCEEFKFKKIKMVIIQVSEDDEENNQCYQELFKLIADEVIVKQITK